MAQQDPGPSFLSTPKKKSLINTSMKNWKSNVCIPGIASDKERDAIDKLYSKFKEISNQKGVIQKTINNLDTEYLTEQKLLNDSFNSMINLLEKRKKILLNNMGANVIKYKTDLMSKLTLMSDAHNNLKNVKIKYEESINSKNQIDIDKRSNLNVSMIDDALNQYNNQIKKIKPKHPTFTINQQRANYNINNYGKFILKIEQPISPKLNILIRTSEDSLIEVLWDKKFNNEPIARYELDIYKGPMGDPALVKDNEYYTTDILKILEDNIAFYQITDLDDNEEYHVRVRGVLKDDNLETKYSGWIKFVTKSTNSDDNDNDNKQNTSISNDFGTGGYDSQDEKTIENAWNKNFNDKTVDTGARNFAAWMNIFQKVDLGISIYQQKRLFFCMQQIEEGPGSVIVSGDFANFILNVGERFDCKEYHNLCSIIRQKILKK